jgi:probable HAF family extracellular repeat protein
MGTFVSINGIDDAGEIAGTSVMTGLGTVGVIWNTTYPGGPVPIPIPGVTYGPYISPNGTIAYSAAESPDYLFSLTTGPTAIDTVLGPAQRLAAVSNTGIVVGDWASGSFLHAYEVLPGNVVVQPCASPTNCSGANVANGVYFQGVNSTGQVVGYGTINDGSNAVHAFLYSGGSMRDLNGLLASSLDSILGGSGWYLTAAPGINDRGQILAVANNGSTSIEVLLTPADTSGTTTPEPGTLALLGTGTALLYFASRRGKRSSA